ncbi:MAG: hypothetical protein RR346_01715 [Bacteroidales bacterium]
MNTKTLIILGGITMSMLNSCDCNTGKNETACTNEKTMDRKAPYQKKYTNADFYKDGQLQAEVAKAAYLDMLDYYGVPYTDFLKKNLFITDFNLGDLEHVGMAGVFWINNPEYKYFGHEIYLLPDQMITEHRHLPTEFPAKMESWQVRNGWCYNFGMGETTPGAPKHPKSQDGYITATNFTKLHEGDIATLNELEVPHFLRGGDNGVIVTEYGTYHDGNGLRFTNPGVVFTDILNP